MLRLDRPREFFRHLKADLDVPQCTVDAFQSHFQQLFVGNGRPTISLGDMHWSDDPFTVSTGSIQVALYRCKNGKSRANCAYPLDWLKGHDHDGIYDALAHVAQLCLN